MALTRGVSAPLLAEVAKPHFFPAVLVYLDWPDGEVWMHTNRGDISFDGETWSGIGDFGQVSLPEEADGIVASSATISIIGPADIVLDHLYAPIRNRPGRVLWGAVTERAGNVLVGQPFEIFAGYMDACRMTVSDDQGGQVYVLQLTLGTGPGARSGASITHSSEDQRKAFSGDTAGRHTIHATSNARKRTWPE